MINIIKKLKSKILGTGGLYISGNILSNGLIFARNILFLKIFGFSELGQIALIQTIIMMVGLVQFGFINGGYRIYAIGNKSDNESINNTIFTLLFVLLLLSAAFIFAIPLGFFSLPALYIVITGVIAGILSLASTWVSNTLIGDNKPVVVSGINLISSILSVSLAALSFKFGLIFAIISLVMQPFFVLGASLLYWKPIRPTRLELKKNNIKRILSLGFLPFIAGSFVLLSSQVERWTIVQLLGVEYFGRYYLVLVYTSIFTLIPLSLLNLYFPKAIRAFEESRLDDFSALIDKHKLMLAVYIVGVTVLTLVILPHALVKINPQYKDQMYLIYLSLPGIIAITLCNPASLIFNAKKIFRPLLVSGILGLSFNSLFLFLLYYFDNMSLGMVALSKSVASFIVLIYSYYCINTIARLKA